jgi:hypothetical protein
VALTVLTWRSPEGGDPPPYLTSTEQLILPAPAAATAAFAAWGTGPAATAAFTAWGAGLAAGRFPPGSLPPSSLPSPHRGGAGVAWGRHAAGTLAAHKKLHDVVPCRAICMRRCGWVGGWGGGGVKGLGVT